MECVVPDVLCPRVLTNVAVRLLKGQTYEISENWKRKMSWPSSKRARKRLWAHQPNLSSTENYRA